MLQLSSKRHEGVSAWDAAKLHARTALRLQKAIKAGEFMWELIYPKDPKDGSHIKPPNGKYKIKLYIMVSGWRPSVLVGGAAGTRALRAAL